MSKCKKKKHFTLEYENKTTLFYFKMSLKNTQIKIFKRIDIFLVYKNT